MAAMRSLRKPHLFMDVGLNNRNMKHLTKLRSLNLVNQLSKKYHFLFFHRLIIVIALLASIAKIDDSKSLAQTPLSATNSNNYPLVTELNRKSKINKLNNYPLVVELNQKQKLEKQKQPYFIIAPHIVDKQKINSFTTTLILNGIPINHLTEWQTLSGYEFGKDKSNLVVNSLLQIDSKIEENLTSNNIFTVEQTGQYLQLQTVRNLRKVKIDKIEPQIMTSLGIQMSLTADCIFPGSNSQDKCTYTPGLVTDRNSIDRDFLVPNRIISTSNVGDVVSPESLRAIAQPGFQTGSSDRSFGVDLFFPNAGSFSSNNPTDKTSITRTEEIDYKPALNFSKVRQIVKANDQKAVIGLTIRGWTEILDDKNTLLNSAIQMGSEFLPDVEPHIQGSLNKVNENINKNLFIASVNNRIPEQSYTIYLAGFGEANSLKSSTTDIKHTPAAKFNSIWIGISPVTKHSFTSRVRYQPTGEQKIVAATGTEGGAEQDLSLISKVNDRVFSTAQFKDFYSQIYLTYLNQDVNLNTNHTLTEKTNYYPHISFSGNITGSQNVFRYYSGIIFADDLKPYIGLDYTKNTLNDWTYTASAIGYINCDREHYSQILGSISKKINLTKNTNLVISTTFNYVPNLEHPKKAAIITPESAIALSAKANFANLSIGLVNFFGGILPDSIDNSLLANLEIKLSPNINLSAYFTPINENSSRSRYGANAQLRLANSKNSPLLILNWCQNEYNFGTTPSGQNLKTAENIFSITLKLGY